MSWDTAETPGRHSVVLGRGLRASWLGGHLQEVSVLHISVRRCVWPQPAKGIRDAAEPNCYQDYTFQLVLSWALRSLVLSWHIWIYFLGSFLVSLFLSSPSTLYGTWCYILLFNDLLAIFQHRFWLIVTPLGSYIVMSAFLNCSRPFDLFRVFSTSLYSQELTYEPQQMSFYLHLYFQELIWT